MALVVKIADTTVGILSSTLLITDNINDRSSCSFSIDDVSVATGEEVIIENDGTRIFGASIDSYTKSSLYQGSSNIRYQVECIDFNQLADRWLVAKTYESQTHAEIVNDVVSTYLTTDAVTTSTIITGPTIQKATFNRKKVSETLEYLKNSTKVNWNIDYNKQLSTFYREDNVGTALTESDMLDITVDKTREQYRNRQYIRAGQDETSEQTELPSPKPDGVAKNFTTRYVLAKKPTIFVNDVTVSATSVGINGLDTGKDWYWNKNERIIVHDASQTTLTDSDSLKITYTGLIKILVQVDNPVGISERASVEGGSGIYEEVEDVASIDDRTSAQDYANGLLEKYQITEILNIRTRSFRQAGQIVNVTHTKLGISGSYLIESVDIEEFQGEMFYNLRCLSGESVGSWVEFFRSLKNTATDFLINEDEILVILNTTSERTNITSSTTVSVMNALYPADDLYPSDTLYPNTAIVSEVVLGE